MKYELGVVVICEGVGGAVVEGVQSPTGKIVILWEHGEICAYTECWLDNHVEVREQSKAVNERLDCIKGNEGNKAPNFRIVANESCLWCKHASVSPVDTHCNKYEFYVEDKTGFPVCDDFECAE